MLVTWVTKLYFENGDKNVKQLFCFVKQDRFTPFNPDLDAHLFFFSFIQFAELNK